MERRPRLNPVGPAARSDAERVAQLERTVGDVQAFGYPAQTHTERLTAAEAATADLDGRVTALEATVGGAPWTATGDGASTEFDLSAAASVAPADYLVTVAGIDQTGAFTLATITAAVRLTFSEAPPSGVAIVIRHLLQHARTP
jgi:hypothetical protein